MHYVIRMKKIMLSSQNLTLLIMDLLLRYIFEIVGDSILMYIIVLPRQL